MKKPTRILIVEDIAADADLAQRAIRKVLKQCVFQVVETRKDFLGALETFQPDVILADYLLPHFDGMKALKLALKYAPLTPLIIWTRPASEDVAVACMKAGANDYVLKDNLKRLGPALIHALKERQVLLERNQAEAKYGAIFENSVMGVFQSTPEGRYLNVNAAMARMYGYASPQEMAKAIRNIPDQIYVEPGKRAEFITALHSRGTIENIEARNYCKDGSIIWTFTSARAVRDTDGSVIYYEGFVTDITERKQTEKNLQERERQLTTLMDNLPGPVYRCQNDADYTMEFISDGITALSGYEVEDFRQHRRHFGRMIHPDDRERVWKGIQAAIETCQPFELTYRITTAAGEQKWVWEKGQGIWSAEGQLQALEGFITDITERKLMEEKLKESEIKYRTLIEHLPVITYISQPEQYVGVTYISPQIQSLGFDSNEWLADPELWFRQIHPEDQAQVSAELQKFQDNNTTFRAEYRLKMPNGETKWFHDQSVYVNDENGEPILKQGFMLDITERKRAEEALQNSERRFRALIENGLDDISLLNADGTLLWESPSTVRNLGYMPDEFVGRNIFELMHPEDLSWTLDMYSSLTKEPGSRQHGLFRLHRADGTWRWVEAIVTNMLNDPSVRAIVVNYRDTTERKDAEEALRDSQAKYQNLVETSHDLIWSVDADGRFTFVNRAAKEIYGYDPEELLGRSFLEIMDPNYYQNLNEFKEEIIQQDGFKEIETYVRHRDGRQIILSANSIVMRDPNGKMVGITGSSHDITARKQAEEVLKKERNLLRTLIDNLPDRIYAMDLQGRKILSNTADWKASGGKTMEDVIGKTDFDTYPPELAEDFWRLDKAVLDSGIPVFNYEEPGLGEHGNRVSILTTKIPLRNEEGQVIGLVGIGRDITERKQVEAQINDVLAFNETILNHSPVGILTYKLTGECVFANQNAALIIGASVEQLQAQNFHTVESWKKSGLYDLVERAIHTQMAVTADIHHASTFGKNVWMTVHCVTFKLKEEDHVLLLITDITERKRAEERLLQSENRYRLATKATNDVTWEWNPKTKQIHWSENAQHVFGYSNTEIGPDEKWWDDHIHPGDRSRVQSKLSALIAGNEPIWLDEYRFQLKDDSYAYISDRGYIERDEKGTPIRMIGAMSDITHRKESEVERQALLEIMQGLAHPNDLQELLKLIHHSIAQVIYAENFFVILYQPNSGLFEEIYSVDQYDPPGPPSKMEKSITSYVFRSGEPLLLTQPKFDELSTRDEVVLIGTDSRSWLGVPLKTSGRTIGVMAVQDYENDERYSERDRDFLASIAAQIALVIERKQAEEALRESEEHYRAIFEGVQDAIFVEATDGRILMVNERACEMFRYSRTEFLTKTVSDLVPEGYLILMADGTDPVLTTEPRETFNRRANGEVFPIEISGRLLVIHGETVLLVMVRDITERKRAEELLRESEQRFSSAFEYAPIGIGLVAREGRWLRVNQALCELVGYSQQELLEKTFQDITHPDDLEADLHFVRKMRAGEIDSYQIEKRYFHKFGHLIWVLLSVSLVHDNQENPQYFISQIQDITERKQADIELKQKNDDLGLLNAINVAVVRGQNPDSIIELLAQEMSRIFSNHGSTVYSTIYMLTPDKKSIRLQKYFFPSKVQHNIEKLIGSTIPIIEIPVKEGGYFHRAMISGRSAITSEPQEIQNWIAQFAETKFLPPLAKVMVPKLIPQIRKLLNINSTIVVPLISEGETIGFLDISGSGLFTEHDRKRIENLAGQLTAAIQRQQANEKLIASEERFRQLADNLQEAFWMTDAISGKEIYMSPAVEKIWGKPIDNLMHEPDALINSVFPQDQPDVLRAIAREKNGEKVEIEYRILQPNGSLRWVWDRAFPIFDESGRVQRIAGISADITERKRTEEEVRRRAEETSALLKISLALTNLDLKAILQTISNSAKNLFAADGCRIFLMEPDGKSLRCVLALQENSFAFSDLRVQLGEGVTGTVAASGQAEIVNEMHRDPRSVQVPGTPEEEEAIMFAPLKERDHTIGVLSVRRAGNQQPFQPDDLGLLEAFASMAASAVSNARLFEETQRRLAELQALYENGLAVGRLLKPGEIGNRIINTFDQYLRWHHVTIRLRRGDGDDLELVAFNLPNLREEDRSHTEQHFVERISKVGQGLSGWVIQTGAPFRTGNVHAHPQYVDIHPEIQSGLYMPLKVGGRVIGVISVESEIPNGFTEQDERLLATLASQAAIAFENARLYEAMQKELLERKRVEDALRISETHYRELADSITDILFEMDQNLHYTHWNRASELFTGIPAEQAIGKSMMEVFGTSEEQSQRENIYRSVLRERQPKTFEVEMISSGQRRAIEINAYPSTRGVSVVAKDITDRKRSETIMQKRFELMEYSAHHTLIELMRQTVDEVSELTGSSIGFFHFVEPDQITLSMQTWSTNALRLFKVPASEGMHLPLDQAGMRAEAIRQRRSLIQNDYASLSERTGLPEGYVPMMREILIPIMRNEKIVAVMGIGNKPNDYTPYDLEIAERLADYAWDITERKQMEEALAEERNRLARRVEERTADLSRANSNLARALRVKDEFLANMSHELRTPLNAILGLSESLGEQIAGPLNEKQQKYITTISESGHHLLSLINDILDLAKIEAGQITLDINKVDIYSVCQASLRMIKQLAQKKKQEVTLNIEDGLGLMWADERRLKQMMVNLLGNAVKFTPENGRLGLDVRGDKEANKITITVSDNGIGIKPDDLSRLFQPFMQLDSGLDRETTGTGLGLALVAQMARLHGGSVNAVSEPGVGSRFAIVLPWEPALAIETASRLRSTGKFPAIKPDSAKRPTILLVEDTKEVTMMIKDYLELAGYTIVTAQDGVDAIVQAKLTHPDLILMDVQMPRMDGLEATRKLRSEPDFRYTPILALTALAMPNDRERCLAAGMDEYISKPINLKALVKLIQSCLFNSEEPKSR